MTRRPGRGKRERGPEEARQWLRENQGAFADWPRIEALSDEFGFHVTGKVISPAARFMPGCLAGMIMLAGAVLGAVVGSFIVTVIVGADFAGLGGFVGFFGLATGLAGSALKVGRELCGSKVDVIITPGRIGVGRTFKYEWIERRFGAAFEVVRPHSKAREEEEREIRMRKRQKPIYRKSDEVILNTGARRVVIAEIYDDERRSEKLHMTLFLLNQAVN